MTICKNCSSEVALNYCPKCGQQPNLKRIDGHYISHEIEHLLHFERGILYTVRELLLRPGATVRRFISDDRSRLVKPVIFLIITSLIYTLVSHFFHIEDGYMKFEGEKKSSTGAIFEWIQAHYGYANIIMGIFIAFWAMIFFKKYNYNFFEILIVLCFAMGMAMLIFAFCGIIYGIAHIDIMQIGGCIGIIYCAWAIGQFFDKRKFSSYAKALGAYILGMVMFSFLAIAAGMLIDAVIKH